MQWREEVMEGIFVQGLELKVKHERALQRRIPMSVTGRDRGQRRLRGKVSRRDPWAGAQVSAAAAAAAAGSAQRPERGQGPPALHVTRLYGEVASVELMVGSTVEQINGRDSLGSHPIHSVLSPQYPQNKSASLKYLLEQKADVNVPAHSGQTPLHLAASEGFLDCAEILVKAGADVLAKDSNGHTPLDLARIWCRRKVARYLKNCSWEAEKKLELKERQLLQALHRDLVDLVTKQNDLSKRKLTDEKMAEWATKKGFAPLKDFSPRVRVSLYHTKCLSSDQTRTNPKWMKGLSKQHQPEDSEEDKLTPAKQTAAPSPSPWSIFINLQPEETPTGMDLRKCVTLSRDSRSRQLQYTTKWDCMSHPTPNLSQDMVERVLFPRAFPARLAEPQKIDEGQHRRNPQGGSTCIWTEVATHLAEVLEAGHH
ncbi:ankyrin repeat domain-containing protein 53 [Cololabis saira]|uniref:ankyrin repeat domain-containing protein 53 n=1 Tax=Cololabis saira TaxID=129043 RepID=UPI002AD2A21F|nr:ankyrin repeat domain-containing protein 53 [Cololabis saira]